MARLSELEVLELWRQELARRSDRYRDSLSVDYTHIHASTGWVRQAFAWGRAAAPLLVWLAPVGLFLIGRKRLVPKTTVGKVVFGVQAARSVKSIWKALASNASDRR